MRILGPLFFGLKRRITAALEVLKQDNFWQANFVGTDHGMQGSVDSAMFIKNRRWFIGIDRGTASIDAIQELFKGNLDWKLGSGAQIEKLFKSRDVGLQLKLSANVPKCLPQANVAVLRSCQLRTRRLGAMCEPRVAWRCALMIRMIHQRDKLPGSKSLELKVGGNAYTLQVALFGVT